MKSKCHRLLWIGVVIGLPALALGEDADETPASQDDKGYHFFVGANLRIPYEETFFPVERIWNARAHIKVDDAIIVQKVRNIKEIKVDRRAKISTHFVQITDLSCEPEYSVGRDPKTIAARQQVTTEFLTAAFDDEVDSSYRQIANPDAFMEVPDVGLTTKLFTSEGADSEVQLLQDLSQLERYQSSARSFRNASDVGDVSSSDDRPMWDMLHVRFSISSDTYLPSAYLAFVFQLTDRPEGEPVMSWFHFLSLKDISSETKSYNYRLTAYPDGMYIASKEAFLFSNGAEIATNLSSKLVAMKEKDARTFLKYQYLAENSGKTRPPERAWKYLDLPLRDKITLEIRDKTITLKIDAEGQVQDLRTSPEVQSTFSPEEMYEITSLIYLPALENGKPVPGELTLALKDVILE